MVPGDIVIVWNSTEAMQSDSRDWFMAEVVVTTSSSNQPQSEPTYQVIDIETGATYLTEHRLVRRINIPGISPAQSQGTN
jgi:hypothetical protein